MRSVLVLVLLGSLVAGAEVSRDPTEVYKLTSSERVRLDDQGLVALVSSDSQLYDAYFDARRHDWPVFVTTDLPLHTFHILFDFALRDAEQRFFYPALDSMLRSLLRHQSSFAGSAEPKVVREAARDNVAFLSVPLSILDSTFAVDSSVATLVARERRLIEAAEGWATSAVFGIMEDYSQYRPRGHYTISERLRRYFRAMMYLGRMSFERKPAGNEALGITLTRRAVLLSAAFAESPSGSARTVAALWRRVYEPTAWMVGEADDALPTDYLRLFQSLSRGVPVSEWAAADSNIRRFIVAAESLSMPRINSSFRWQGEEPSEGMRLMGQRFMLDSYVFEQLVYDKVGVWPDSARLLPKGLDVMAALGSERARLHLLETYNEDRYLNYTSQLDSLSEFIRRLPEDDWAATMVMRWLRVLRLNLEPVEAYARGATVPRFVRSDAYADKTLVTACGSWAELRHDVVLYSKQVYEEFGYMPLGREVPKHKAYVEPKPSVFRELAALTRDLGLRLSVVGASDEAVLRGCERLANDCDRLAELAQKGLDGVRLSTEDTEFCMGLGGRLNWLVGSLVDPPTGERVGHAAYDSDPEPMPVVADVATDPNKGQVLEVAVGHPLRLLVRIPFHGSEYTAVGSCFSYYEFTKPMTERMTDEEWRALTPKPPMPVWARGIMLR
ncbi:MAG: DUF3160 domain-containing protein [bacterium]